MAPAVPAHTAHKAWPSQLRALRAGAREAVPRRLGATPSERELDTERRSRANRHTQETYISKSTRKEADIGLLQRWCFFMFLLKTI